MMFGLARQPSEQCALLEQDSRADLARAEPVGRQGVVRAVTQQLDSAAIETQELLNLSVIEELEVGKGSGNDGGNRHWFSFGSRTVVELCLLPYAIDMIDRTGIAKDRLCLVGLRAR
jgi:hypothetical protein